MHVSHGQTKRDRHVNIGWAAGMHGLPGFLTGAHGVWHVPQGAYHCGRAVQLAMQPAVEVALLHTAAAEQQQEKLLFQCLIMVHSC